MAKETPKSKASKAMSRFIRLRDAIGYCARRGIDLHCFSRPEDILGQCCTCNAVKSWIRMDAGHWIGRGIGGGSGVYFDERNVNLQCKQCNAFLGGMVNAHEEYLLKKYGRETVDDIARKHYASLDMSTLALQAIEQYYKDEYKRLVKEYL